MTSELPETLVLFCKSTRSGVWYWYDVGHEITNLSEQADQMMRDEIIIDYRICPVDTSKAEGATT